MIWCNVSNRGKSAFATTTRDRDTILSRRVRHTLLPSTSRMSWAWPTEGSRTSGCCSWYSSSDGGCRVSRRSSSISSASSESRPGGAGVRTRAGQRTRRARSLRGGGWRRAGDTSRRFCQPGAHAVGRPVQKRGKHSERGAELCNDVQDGVRWCRKKAPETF